VGLRLSPPPGVADSPAAPPSARTLASVRTARALAVLVLLAATCLGVAPVATPAATPDATPDAVVHHPGDPSYAVRLRSAQGGRVWTGRANISFTNIQNAPLRKIYLRLWSNGVDGCGNEAIVIWDLKGGALGPPGLDCTEVPVTLSRPLATGERTTLSMRLRITLPRRADRFGYSNGLALVGSALPALAVRDDRGRHRAPFVDLGESFYSVVGRYRVTLVTPPHLDTPTTGTLAGTKTLPSGLVARTYAATRVRDFAWAAGRLQQVAGDTAGTRVVVSYRPGSVTPQQASAMLAAARRSLATFSAAFGSYPYPELDVVLGAFPDFGGMEYPTIVFSEVDKWTVAHEIAHQWWYGLVGNDQYAEPWLDESLATWSEELPFGAWVGCPAYSFPGNARLTNDMGYWAAYPGRYDTVYDGGGCMLADLARRFGKDRFIRVLRDYAADHRLGVARTGDFTAAIEEAAVRFGVAFDPASYWAAWRVDTP